MNDTYNDINKWGQMVKIILLILKRGNLIDNTEYYLIKERLSGSRKIKGSLEDVERILEGNYE